MREIRFDKGFFLLGRVGEFSHLPDRLRKPADGCWVVKHFPSVMSQLRKLSPPFPNTSSNMPDREFIEKACQAIMDGRVQVIVFPRVSETGGGPAGGSSGASSKPQTAGPGQKPAGLAANTGSEERSDSPSQWPPKDRVAAVIRRTADKPDKEVASDVKQDLLSLLSPKSLELMTATIEGAISAPEADVVIAAIAYASGGLDAIPALGVLVECFKKTNGAKSKQDLDTAADALARAVGALKFKGLMAVLPKLRRPKGGAGATDAGKTAGQTPGKESWPGRAERLKERERQVQKKNLANLKAQTSSVDAKGTSAKGPLDWSIVKKSTGETRVQHVRAHGADNRNKPFHGVFDRDPVATTQEAWNRAQTQGIKPVRENGADVYTVPMGGRVGWQGGANGSGKALTNVKIVTQAGTTKLITGYPE
jgi:hypothetical protein